MGYFTSFNLTTSVNNEIDHYNILEELRSENECARYALTKNGEVSDTTKWYNHEKDMREFSKKHPNVLFILRGEGEFNDDMWIKYFKNGKMQSCKATIVYPDYNEAELE